MGAIATSMLREGHTQAAARFDDSLIAEIAAGSRESIALWIERVAGEHGVAFRLTYGGWFAREASRLSDADVKLDDIEHLLVALSRARVLTPYQAGLLQLQYLR